jgi:hypothetical protein
MEKEIRLDLAAERNRCCHYWIIADGDGPTSKGVCKTCHEEREFSNTLPAQKFDGHLPQAGMLIRNLLRPAGDTRRKAPGEDILPIDIPFE